MKYMTKDQCHQFWQNPPGPNNHKYYAKKKNRSIVIELVKKYINRQGSILELGPNMGLTLLGLWKAGYKDLTGIEINGAAVEYFYRRWPQIQANYRIGTIEFWITNMPKFDLIFSKAVLCHIHPDSEWIFKEIAKRCSYLLTVEDEKSFKSGRHFPRNYKQVFEDLGMVQIEYRENVPGMNESYKARVFKR